MILRRLAAVPLLALFVLSGCTDSDDSSAETDSSAENAQDETEVELGGEESEPVTVSDGDFAATIGPIREQLSGSDDVCAIIGMINSVGDLPEPTGPAQMKDAVDLSADIFVSIGSAIDEGDPEAAATIVRLSDEMRSEAEAAGYPDDFLATSTTFDDPAFATAMESATAIAVTDCPDLIGTEATAGG